MTVISGTLQGMDFSCHVDHREHSLVSLLRHTDMASSVVVRTLEVGDVSLWLGDRCIALMERKTLADLAASIKDGRYKTQHGRLRGMRECGTPVFYIIEGHLDYGDQDDQSMYGMPKRSLTSFMINTVMRDDFKLVCTNGVHDTAKFLVAVWRRASSKPHAYLSATPQPPVQVGASDAPAREAADDAPPLRTRTRMACFINQLRQVPGISTKTAEAIATSTNVTSIAELCAVVGGASTARQLLSDIKTVDTSGKQRRISQAVVDNLVTFIF